MKDKLPVSESVAFEVEKNQAYYLKTMVPGETLLQEKYLNNPILLEKLGIEFDESKYKQYVDEEALA